MYTEKTGTSFTKTRFPAVLLEKIEISFASDGLSLSKLKTPSLFTSAKALLAVLLSELTALFALEMRTASVYGICPLNGAF